MKKLKVELERIQEQRLREEDRLVGTPLKDNSSDTYSNYECDYSEVLVRNIPYTATKEKLMQYFKFAGRINYINIA